MGSGSSVPVDNHKVSTLLSALPEEERQGLVALSPTLAEMLSPGNPSEGNEDDGGGEDDGESMEVPQQVKVKVARMCKVDPLPHRHPRVTRVTSTTPRRSSGSWTGSEASTPTMLKE